VLIEQVEVTKLLGVTLNCKLSSSKHIDTTVAGEKYVCNKALLYLHNSTINKAGSTGPSFVAHGLGFQNKLDTIITHRVSPCNLRDLLRTCLLLNLFRFAITKALNTY
jgi:hypothetical protein